MTLSGGHRGRVSLPSLGSARKLDALLVAGLDADQIGSSASLLTGTQSGTPACRAPLTNSSIVARVLLVADFIDSIDPGGTFANCRQWGSSRRFNLKRMGDRISPPTTKIVTPATMSRMLNGSSSRLASRGKRDSGM